jgi:hypothetical protein
MIIIENLVQISIQEDPILNINLFRHDQFLPFTFRSIIDVIASPKINQSETPIDTMATSFAGVELSREREITERARLDENITLGYGSVDPACIMESENKSRSFAPVE